MDGTVWYLPTTVTSLTSMHYRISILRRVPQAQGEAPRAHGEDFAEGRARRSADGNYRHGKGRVCHVSNFGHTANNFAMFVEVHGSKKQEDGGTGT